MSGELWTEVPVQQTPDEVWTVLVRTLDELADRGDDPPSSGRETLVVDLAGPDVAAPDELVEVTIDHDARRSRTPLPDLRGLPPMTALLEVVPGASGGSVVRGGVAMEGLLGGLAGRLANLGPVRRRLTERWEPTFRQAVVEFLDLAVDADDEELRRLLREGTPTLQAAQADLDARREQGGP